MAIENAAILKLVARLVMDYLDEQNLTDAYNTFCETSRHISDEEYSVYSQGIKTLDTGLCLINIVKEYFLIKELLRDFIKTSPKTSIVIRLIDTTNVQLRVEVILKALKDNLLKIDQVQEEMSRKRRKTENDMFDVSQTNTSTPESTQPSKKRKISHLKPSTSLVVSHNINEKKSIEKNSLASKDVSYISSPDTSNKEDDVTDDESIPPNNKKMAPPPELLSETLLKKPDFAENLAEIINKTLAEHENSAQTPTKSQNILTQDDVQDILSKTENDFEDILKEVIDKYLIDESANSSSNNKANDCSKELPAESSKQSLAPEEIPLKQRLRPRTATKKPLASSEKKKKKIEVLSNEIYSGPLPICLSSGSVLSTQNNEQLVLVPIMPSTTTFIPLQSFSANGGNIICENTVPITTTAELPTNLQIIFTETPGATIGTSNIVSNGINTNNIIGTSLNSNNNTVTTNFTSNNHDEKKEISEITQKTPKTSIQPNFLESKCKSTPRRKASHVRILDFTQTPSGRLATIKEFKTPSNSAIKTGTPGSAPASIMVSQKVKCDKEVTESSTKLNENVNNTSIEIIDDSSNSNSISHTPKVAKNRRRRKIEIDSKLDKIQEEASPKPMTQEEWMKMREEQKSMAVDDRMRFLFQQNEQKSNFKKRKTPRKKKKDDTAKKQQHESAKKSKPVCSNSPHGKSKIGPKFKVTSPRKSAMLRKTPKKKRTSCVVNLPTSIENKENKLVEVTQKEVPKNEKESVSSMPKLMSPKNNNVEKKQDDANDSTDLNRSDTVQEVAKLLTHLPETILAKNSSGTFEQTTTHTNIAIIDSAILMETPLKVDSISPLPNTPRFAVPLTSTHQETPVSKDIVEITTAPSILKFCDILTPSFPITPGLKVTPAKSDPSPGGYCSRKTDYSSCSSYYKPDESEDINQNLDNIIRQCRSSQSESDGGKPLVIADAEKKEKIRSGSTKKVECPGALERVLSFTEETNDVPMPHYNMNEDGLLSESMITTCSDESSSSFTCSTCSTDPSSDENTMEKLNKASSIRDSDRDSEWHCEDEVEIEIESNKSLVDEKTGEVRFPLRNWITPKKIEPLPTTSSTSKIIIEKVLETICVENVKSAEEKAEEEQRQRKAQMEAVRLRTISILRKETATVGPKKAHPIQKFRKANVKQFKLPAIEHPKPVVMTRRDQILHQNLAERPKSTPLKLIPSVGTSSSRRKCLTPRKTVIVMDELPKADPVVRKTNKKRQSGEKPKTETVKSVKSPAKPERVSMENISDNAVMMNDEYPSLNISASFNESTSDEEHAENTVVDNSKVKDNDEGSNTFQRTLIAQGFDKAEAKDLQTKFVDKIEDGQKTTTDVMPDNVTQEIEMVSNKTNLSEKISTVTSALEDVPNSNNVTENVTSPTKEPGNLNNSTKMAENASSAPKVAEDPNSLTKVSENDGESDDENSDDCEFAFSDALDRNIFTFAEAPGFVPKKVEAATSRKLCPPSKLQIDGKTIKIDFTELVDIFSMEPTKKETHSTETDRKETAKSSEPKILTKEISIDKILTMIHGNH